MSARLAASARRELLPGAPYEEVGDGVGLGVPPAGGPLAGVLSPPPSMSESVGVAVGLGEPVPGGVGLVGGVVGVGDVLVGVAVGDDVVGVGVGVGDVALAVGVGDTVGDGIGLAAGEVAAEHDGDGVGDGGADGMRPAAVFGAVGVTERTAPCALVEWTSTLVQSTMRDGGQSGEGAGLADAVALGVVVPGPGAAPL
jgi:hypothetical protein